MKTTIRALGAAALLLLAVASPAFAGGKSPGVSTTWNGKGTSSDGSGGRTLDTTLCSPTAGATTTGNYLLFILSSTGNITSTPTISFGAVSAGAMTKSNGTKSGQSNYRYVYTSSSAIDLVALVGNVTANWSGSGTPTFTVSHGCTGSGGGSSLTVNFIGYYNPSSSGPSGPVPGWEYLDFEGLGSTFKVCESGSTTSCVNFPTSATPGSSGTITLSGPSKTLDIIYTDDVGGAAQIIGLWNATVAASAFGSSSPVESAIGSFTTTSTFSNGGSVWFTAQLE